MKFLLSFLILLSVLQNDTSKKRCDELISKGIDALYQKNHTKSLELFTEARSLSEQNDWYLQQFIATNCIGLNYYQMLDYSEALDYYLEAYTIALKHLNKDREMTVLNNIALVYLRQGKYKESEKHQKRAYDLAISNKDTIGIALYAGNLADLTIRPKNWTKPLIIFPLPGRSQNWTSRERLTLRKPKMQWSEKTIKRHSRFSIP